MSSSSPFPFLFRSRFTSVSYGFLTPRHQNQASSACLSYHPASFSRRYWAAGQSSRSRSYSTQALAVGQAIRPSLQLACSGVRRPENPTAGQSRQGPNGRNWRLLHGQARKNPGFLRFSAESNCDCPTQNRCSRTPLWGGNSQELFSSQSNWTRGFCDNAAILCLVEKRSIRVIPDEGGFRMAGSIAQPVRRLSAAGRSCA